MMKNKWIKLAVVIVLGIGSFAYSMFFQENKLVPQTKYGAVYVSKIVSVYDGDTFTCNVDAWPPIFGKKCKVRLAGIDTPEKRGTSGHIKQLALTARDFSRTRLMRAKKIELRNIQRGKYFRILAEVYVDGENLSEALIRAGLAKKYDGGKKPRW